MRKSAVNLLICTFGSRRHTYLVDDEVFHRLQTVPDQLAELGKVFVDLLDDHLGRLGR